MDRRLTHEFGGAEDIFEVDPGLYFVRQSEVDEFDAGEGHVSVQEHDVLRLEKEKWRSTWVRTPLQTATLGVMGESGLPVGAAKAAFCASIRGKLQELVS